jgi:hypothetical protein
MKHQILLICPFLLLAGTPIAWAADAPPYAAYYDPATGFQPAQANLGKVFLQLAGSLEATGSPEGYIRHSMADLARIDAKYHAATGKGGSTRPAYLTDEYIDDLLSGWKKLEQVLKLDSLCRESGKDMRYAILGGWNKSTAELIAQETALSDEESKTYAQLLAKPWFTKADFPILDAFAKTSLDKLTEEGKARIRERTWRGTRGPEERRKELEKPPGGTVLVTLFNDYQDKLVADMAQGGKRAVTSSTLKGRLVNALQLDAAKPAEAKAALSEQDDAVLYSGMIMAQFQRRFDHIQKAASPEQAETMRGVMTSMVSNLLVIAHSEYEAAVYEAATDKQAKN